jgi:hypothetical protein
VTKVSKEILSTFKQYEKHNAKQREAALAFLGSLAQYESLTTPFANTNTNANTAEGEGPSGELTSTQAPPSALLASSSGSTTSAHAEKLLTSKRIAAVARETEAYQAECALEFGKALQPLVNWRAGLLQEVLVCLVIVIFVIIIFFFFFDFFFITFFLSFFFEFGILSLVIMSILFLVIVFSPVGNEKDFRSGAERFRYKHRKVHSQKGKG